MSEYTKVNVKKTLIEKIKIKATLDNRSITKYIEQLILKDLALNQSNKVDKEKHE